MGYTLERDSELYSYALQPYLVKLTLSSIGLSSICFFILNIIIRVLDGVKGDSTSSTSA